MLESASGSAFIFSKGEREWERFRFLASEREHERVRHFEERANALSKFSKSIKKNFGLWPTFVSYMLSSSAA